jgi:hypothetical protein
VVKAETDRLLPYFATATGLAAHPPSAAKEKHLNPGH